MSRARLLRWLGLALVIFLVAFWALGLELQPDGARWLPVERHDLVVSVDVEGELRAAESVLLGPPQIADVWNFKIAFLAPEGTEVEVGDRLLSFDVTQLEQSLQEMIAERDAAEKELEKLITDLESERRDKELQLEEARARLRKTDLELNVPADVTARLELDVARIDRRMAKLEIASIERALEHLAEQNDVEIRSLSERRDRAAARVAELEQQIERMTITAPRAGTLIYVTRRQQEKKKVGDSVWRAEKILEIPSLSKMVAAGEVDEDQAGRLAVGQPVSLRLDAYPDRSYRGTVETIRRTVQSKSRSNPQKIVKIEIALDETDRTRMRPGMRFRGTIETRRVTDALVVPEEAVFSRPGGAVVYVHSVFGPREVRPTFGARNADAFEVIEGLDEGSRVLRRDAAAQESS